MNLSNTCKVIFSSLSVLAMLGLAACGGGGGGGGGTAVAPPPTTTLPPETANGVFKDSNVSGLSYESGSETGTTGTDGGFTYEVGQQVAFSVGGVLIGSATGDSVITPLNLVSGSSSSTPEVQNIVRFLLMLDTDGDPSNGITISSAVQMMSDSWEEIEFATTDLAADLISIISDAASVDGTLHALPDVAEAQSHLESTLLCVRAGAYQGSFTGDDNGPFFVVFDAATGFVSGLSLGIGIGGPTVHSLTGTAAVGFDQDAAFVIGDVASGTTFSGQFTGSEEISGTWQSSPVSGTFSGTRVGGSTDAVYRFTGLLSGGDQGFFTFDVDGSNNVTGDGYSLSADEIFPLEGNVSGTNLEGTSTTASGGMGGIAGTLDTTSGVLDGTWDYPPLDYVGTMSGSGCRLN